MREIAALVVGASLLAACSSSRGEGVSPRATVAHRTTTSSTSTSVAPGQENFLAIMRGIMQRRDEAYEQSKPEILDELYEPRCDCLAFEQQLIRGRAAKGLHTSGERNRVLSTSVVNRISPELVVVRVIAEQGPNNLVASDGHVVEPGETTPPTSYVFTLGLFNGHWLVEYIDEEGPVSSTTTTGARS